MTCFNYIEIFDQTRYLFMSELLSSPRISYFMSVCNSCLNVLIFYCAIHDRCNILQGNTWLNKKSQLCVYRQTGASFCISVYFSLACALFCCQARVNALFVYMLRGRI